MAESPVCLRYTICWGMLCLAVYAAPCHRWPDEGGSSRHWAVCSRPCRPTPPGSSSSGCSRCGCWCCALPNRKNDVSLPRSLAGRWTDSDHRSTHHNRQSRPPSRSVRSDR
uniref:Putative secreted protein n=1 Tax=Anopheles darlingi TaxID=43151 RepID=A0A2M4D0N8_ANODA